MSKATVLVSNIDPVSAIVALPSGIYFGTSLPGGGTVCKIPLEGGAFTILANGLPAPLQLVSDGGRIERVPK